MKNLCLFLVAVAALGCAPAEIEHKSAGVSTTFEGELKPELTGTWKQEGANLTMSLAKDGAYGTTGTIMVRGAETKVDVKGKWLATADRIYLKEEPARPDGAVAAYKWELKNPDTLHFVSRDPKRPTIYVRKK